MPSVEKQARALVANYKHRVLEYIKGFRSKVNKGLQEYIRDVKVAADSQISLVVQFPVDAENNQYEPVTVPFTCPTHVTFTFMGLAFRQLTVEIQFPGVIFGPTSAIPRIVFRAPTPRSWPGHYGLYFDPNNPKDVGWYPFESLLTKRAEIQKHHEGKIQDAMTDFLNSTDADCAKTVRKNLKNFFSRKYFPLFYYRSFTDKSKINQVPVPLAVHYDATRDESTMILETFAQKDYWMQPEEVALDFFEGIAEATNYFDDEGYLFPDGPHPPEWVIADMEAMDDKKERGEAKKQAKLKKKKMKRKEEAVFFQPAERVKRDAMGYVIYDKDGKMAKDSEFVLGALDIEKQRIEKFRAREKERLAKAKAQEDQRKKVDVTRFRDAKDWYDQFATQQFTVEGNPELLSFVERGNFNLLKSLKPPFILTFAKDQIRMKKGMTTRQCADFLFDAYGRGFLVPVQETPPAIPAPTPPGQARGTAAGDFTSQGRAPTPGGTPSRQFTCPSCGKAYADPTHTPSMALFKLCNAVGQMLQQAKKQVEASSGQAVDLEDLTRQLLNQTIDATSAAGKSNVIHLFLKLDGRGGRPDVTTLADLFSKIGLTESQGVELVNTAALFTRLTQQLNTNNPTPRDALDIIDLIAVIRDTRTSFDELFTIDKSQIAQGGNPFVFKESYEEIHVGGDDAKPLSFPTRLAHNPVQARTYRFQYWAQFLQFIQAKGDFPVIMTTLTRENRKWARLLWDSHDLLNFLTKGY